MHMHALVCSMYAQASANRDQKGHWIPEAGLTGDCEPPYMGAVNQILVLSQSILSHFSSPHHRSVYTSDYKISEIQNHTILHQKIFLKSICGSSLK